MTRNKSPLSDEDSNAGNVIGYTDGGQPIVAEPGDGQLSNLDIERDLGTKERIIPFNSARTTFPARKAKDTEK